MKIMHHGVMVAKNATKLKHPLIGPPRDNPVAANKVEFSAGRPDAVLLKLKENKVPVACGIYFQKRNKTVCRIRINKPFCKSKRLAKKKIS